MVEQTSVGALEGDLARRPVIVLGSSGMLGRAVREECSRRGLPFEGFDLPELDVTQLSDLEACVREGSMVVNCAAWTDVDAAEDSRPQAFAVNAGAVEKLVRTCEQKRSTLVHFSTDYVFDGTGSTPYGVDAPTSPINVYGSSKELGEQALRAARCPTLLVRTSWLYAPWGKNFLRTIAQKSLERAQLDVVDDQWGRPTSAQRLAWATLELAGGGHRGAFHVTDGGEPCSWFQFAEQVVAVLGRRCKVVSCASEAYPTRALRPRYSVLDISKTETLLGSMAPWRDEVRRVCEQLPGEL